MNSAPLLRRLICWVGLSLSSWAHGEPVLHIHFENLDGLAAWTNSGAGKAEIVENGSGGHVLKVETAQISDHLVRIPLPLEKVRGMRVALSARVKADQVVKAAEPWHGVKVMLQTDTPHGPTYENVPNLAGTFDWQTVGITTEVPADATAANILLGLGQASGTAWFDDVSASLAAVPRTRPSPQPTLSPPEKLDRRTEIARLRGVMYGPRGNEADLRVLADWKGNLIRWQLFWYDGGFPEKRTDLALYDRWLKDTLANIDHLLPVCRELGLKLVIDLHTPPAGMDAGQMAIFRQEIYQQKFIEVWDQLATHFRDEPAVWAYDLLNEPSEGSVAEGLMNWRDLAERVAQRVRAIDPHHAIIVEPGPNGGWANLPFFEPLKVPGVIYSVHMYDPLAFTHQGIMDGMPKGVSYPGVIAGNYWDRAALKRNLEPVREYQRDYNVPIYIGEFSAPRWAPGDSAAAYLRDCISIFEEYGWDWSYHAFREWQGWNVELGSDPDDQKPSKEPTERLKVLRAGFEKNVAPSGGRSAAAPTPAAGK